MGGGKVGAPENAVYVAYTQIAEAYRDLCSLLKIGLRLRATRPRFIFLTRRCDSPLDFDLELAKSASDENPVYYVQYAHTRLCSLLREAAKADFAAPSPEDDLGSLGLPEEIELIKQLALYPELMIGAAEALEPHRLTAYLQDLAARFHGYYTRHRIISADPVLTRARLALVAACRVVIGNALGLLGVSAPERM